MKKSYFMGALALVFSLCLLTVPNLIDDESEASISLSSSVDQTDFYLWGGYDCCYGRCTGFDNIGHEGKDCHISVSVDRDTVSIDFVGLCRSLPSLDVLFGDGTGISYVPSDLFTYSGDHYTGSAVKTSENPIKHTYANDGVYKLQVILYASDNSGPTRSVLGSSVIENPPSGLVEDDFADGISAIANVTVTIDSHSAEEDLNFTTPDAIDSISGSSFNYIPGANITGTTFTKVSGADWMSFSNGKITGTAPSVTEKTSYQAVLKAVSPLGQERTQTITVNVYPVAQITASSNVINALVGQSITPLVLSSNIPCTYSMSGTLPDGLSFDPNTATFSGSTSAKGKYTITVTGTTTEGIVQNPTIQVTVNVADVLSITSVPPSGLQLTSSLYTYTPIASVSGVIWTIENAPDWLVVSENKVTGTVPPLSDATTFTYILKAIYVYESITQEKTQEVTITVEPTLTFTTVPTASMVIVPVYSYNPDGTPVLGANADGNNDSKHTGTYKFVYTGEGATSLLWDFGDGTTSEDWTAVHTYEKSGTYTVTLTATNEKGSTTCTQELTVDLGDSASDLIKYVLVALIVLCVLYIAYSLILKRNNRRR